MMRASVPPRWVALLLIVVLLAGSLLSGPLTVRAATPCGKWTIKADGQDKRVKIVPVTVGDDCRGSFRFENNTVKIWGLVGGYGLDLRVNGPVNSGTEWLGYKGNVASLIPSLDTELFIAPKDVAKQEQITIDGAVTPQSFAIDMGLFLLFSALDAVPLPAVDCLIPKSAIVFAVVQSVQILAASADRLIHLDSAAIDELLQVTDEFFDRTISALKDVAKGCAAEILKPFLTRVLEAVTGVTGILTVTKIVLGLVAYTAVMVADNVKYHGKSLRATFAYEPAAPTTPAPLPSLRSVNWADVLMHDPDLSSAPPTQQQKADTFCVKQPINLWVRYTGNAHVEGIPDIASILYGDIAGDGGEEAIIYLFAGCGASRTVSTGSLIYRTTPAGPRIVTDGPDGATIANNHLEVIYSIYKPGEPHCCPTGGTQIDDYQLQGNKLVQIGSRIETPTPKPAPLPLLRNVDWNYALTHDPDLQIRRPSPCPTTMNIDFYVTYRGSTTGLPYRITYGDLDGDGIEEAIISLSSACTGSSSFASLIYRMTLTGPKIITAGPSNDHLLDLTISNQVIIAKGSVYLSGDAGCCPSGGTKVIQYRLQGDQLVQVNIQYGNQGGTPIPAVANEIAYVVQGDLWIANIDGTKARKIVSGPLQRPAWSHDGKRISYLRQFSDQYPTQIEIVNAEGSNKTVVVPQKPNPRGTPQYQYLTRIRWEQNDTAIYYTYSYGNSSGKGIIRHDLQGGAERDMNIYASDFDVARDGTFVTESYDNSTGKSVIALVSPGGQPKNLLSTDSNGGAISIGPVWSPDGTQIALRGSGLRIVSRDLKQDRTIQWFEGSPQNIAWRSDGRALFYAEQGPRDGSSPNVFLVTIPSGSQNGYISGMPTVLFVGQDPAPRP